MKTSQMLFLIGVLTLIFSFPVFGCTLYLSRIICTRFRPEPYYSVNPYGVNNEGGFYRGGGYGGTGIGNSVPLSMASELKLSNITLYSVNQSEVVVVVPDVVKDAIKHGTSAEREKIGQEVGELLDSIGYKSNKAGFELVLMTKVPIFDDNMEFFEGPVGPKGEGQTWTQWLGEVFSSNMGSQTSHSGGPYVGGGSDSDPWGRQYGYGWGGYDPWENVPVFHPGWGGIWGGVPVVSICGPGPGRGSNCPGI